MKLDDLSEFKMKVIVKFGFESLETSFNLEENESSISSKEHEFSGKIKGSVFLKA